MIHKKQDFESQAVVEAPSTHKPTKACEKMNLWILLKSWSVCCEKIIVNQQKLMRIDIFSLEKGMCQYYCYTGTSWKLSTNFARNFHVEYSCNFSAICTMYAVSLLRVDNLPDVKDTEWQRTQMIASDRMWMNTRNRAWLQRLASNNSSTDIDLG
jgi:hypothetical protein